ncbi:MAG: hypothetical protein KDA24_08805 [Deltaproteobacteria bacterium]|nr:hypothetical protein [Deltaproteobacteria bacterium]
MRAFLAAASLLVVGCPAEVPCVADLDDACAPLSQDLSWSNVYSTVVVSSCASPGVSCHATEGSAGGLDLGDEETAWEQLVEPLDIAARIVPGDASCSDVMKRVHSDDANYQMPPSSPLSDPQSCMVQLWIDAGAAR